MTPSRIESQTLREKFKGTHKLEQQQLYYIMPNIQIAKALNTMSPPPTQKSSAKRKIDDTSADGTFPSKKKSEIEQSSCSASSDTKQSPPKKICQGNNLDIKISKPKHPSPVVTPSSSLSSMPNMELVPLCALRLPRAKSSSETMFVETTSKRKIHPNATFAFVQRSGKDFLIASIERLGQIVSDHLDACDLEDSKASVARASTVYEDLIGLYGYARDEYYRIILGRANGIQVTMNTLAAFPNNELIQASGIMFIGTLCTKSLPNALKLVECGGLRNIIDGIKNYPKNSNVCSMSINCLALVMESSELAGMFLSKMHDAKTAIESISQDSLTFQSPRNRELVLHKLNEIETRENDTLKSSYT